jgi:hypothetical protein
MRLGCLFIVLLSVAPASAQLRVVSTDPIGHGILGTSGAVSFTFSDPVDPASIDEAISVMGEVSGPLDWTATISTDARTVSFQPEVALLAGEQIQIQLPHSVRSASGAALQHGYWLSLYAAARGGQMEQVEASRWFLRRSDEPAEETNGGALHSTSLNAADLNGDGWPDLMVTNGWPSDVRIYKGGTAGTSVSPQIVELGSGNFQSTGYWPNSISAVDLNRDGLSDLVTTWPTTTILATEQGAFASPAKNWDSSGCSSTAVFDADADGYPDVLAGSGNDLIILRNDGAGDLEAWGSVIPTGFPGNPWGCDIVDFNLDGIVDLVVRRSPANGTLLLVGLGSGAFAEGGRLFTATGPAAAAQIDGDGIPDLLIVDYILDDLYVYPSGNFSGPPKRFFTGDGATVVKAADLDGDGDLDVALATWDGLIVHENVGDGDERQGGGDLSAVTIRMVGAPLLSMSVVDRDRDGDVDIAVLVSSDWSGDADELILFENQAAATAVAPRGELHDFEVFPNPASSVVRFSRPVREPLQVFDMLGRQVGLVRRGSTEFEVTQLPRGLYLLRSSTGSVIRSFAK